MTTPIAPDRLSLRSPDALLAAVPYLLGFRPEGSIVLVWLAASRIICTQRMDLPADAIDPDRWVKAAWGHPASQAADAVVILIVSDDAAPPAVLPALRARAAAEDLTVRDVIRLHEGRWWSLLCDDRSCCPDEGRPVDPAIADAVAAEFAYTGRAVLPAREALVAEMAGDPEAARSVAARLRPTPSRGSGLERWRDRSIAALASSLEAEAGAPIGPVAAAAHLRALADLRVRDTILWDACQFPAERLEGAAAALTRLLRCAPQGLVAPVATCVAALWWLAGDGARAATALERGLDDDPGYGLAQLLTVSLRAGLPPSAWRESMAGLTRDDCRHGTAA